ncbi:MAG: ABC transporter ATP-binding protein [Candidatus Margulisbacteria bacterium]|nr:ABC transporter ATP-binding protein [Candidatus Margulisiibacteriota bacterium]
MIKLRALTKYFGKKIVLDKVDLVIPDGESLAVIGPSGCGKSTLLRILIRLIDPTSGSINIDGEEVTLLSEDGLMRIRQKVGMIFQTAALFDSLSVYENVAFGLRERGNMLEKEIAQTVKDKLALVELSGTEALYPAELSGGMQKRVSIARALAFNPKIILYDEPTTGLDPITSVTIENLMLKLQQELNVTSVIVTHVMQTVNRVAKKIVMLHQGKLIETGSPEETKKTSSKIVKDFITGGL